MATFELALIWEASRQATAAAALVKSLAERLPRERIVSIEVVRLDGAATVHLTLDFSLYSQAKLAELRALVEATGGHLVELLRLAEADRESFRQQFLTSPEGPLPPCESFAEAARLLEAHLANRGPAPRFPAPSSPAGARPAGLDPSARKQSGPEQRQHPRFEVELAVEFKTEADFKKEYTANISKGGIFLRSTQRPPTNSFALLKIDLPNGKQLSTVARVVHVFDHPEHGGIGLCFERADAAFSSALDEYLATLK